MTYTDELIGRYGGLYRQHPLPWTWTPETDPEDPENGYTAEPVVWDAKGHVVLDTRSMEGCAAAERIGFADLLIEVADMDLMLRAITVGWEVVSPQGKHDTDAAPWVWSHPSFPGMTFFAPRSSLRPEITDEIRELMKRAWIDVGKKLAKDK